MLFFFLWMRSFSLHSGIAVEQKLPQRLNKPCLFILSTNMQRECTLYCINKKGICVSSTRGWKLPRYPIGNHHPDKINVSRQATSPNHAPINGGLDLSFT